MRFRFLLILFLFVLGCSDKSNNKISNELISVDPLIDNVLVASDIIKKIDYVPLETNANSVLGGVDKIIFHNGFYYILDRRKQKALFIFDKFGKFKNKVGTIGKGPGEYIDPADFIINKNNKIEILCRFFKKKIIFSLDGKFISEKNIGFHATKFHQLSTDVFAYYHYKPEHNNLKYHLFVINDKEGFTNKYLPQNDVFLFASDYQNFLEYNNQLYFTKSFEKNIYVLNSDNLEPKYTFDFQSYFIEESAFKGMESTQDKIKILNSSPAITGISSFNFFYHHLFFVYTYNRSYRFNFYNLNDNTLKSYSHIKNDINGIPLINLLPIEYQNDNIMILTVSANIIMNAYNSDTNKNNYFNEIEDINESDNPVLLIVKFKDAI